MTPPNDDTAKQTPPDKQPRKRNAGSNAKLEPGHHTIDRNPPLWDPERNAWVLNWSVRLNDGRLLKDRRTQGKDRQQVRRRAREKAEELLTTAAGSAWKLTHRMDEYIDKVTTPAIDSARNADGKPLAKSTRDRYAIAVRLLKGDCSVKNCRHSHSLHHHTIASGVRFRALEKCLIEIAERHGSETAHQTRTVLMRYVLDQLIRDELIEANPIRGVRIDLGGTKKGKGPSGGVALSWDQYTRTLDHLLALDPAGGVEAPKRGRWSIEDRIAKRRNAIDLTLVQIATGLRVSEVNAMTFDENVIVDDGGQMRLLSTEEQTKTSRGREVAVIDERVADRILFRRNTAPGPSSYIIGAPADQTRQWDRDNANKATTALYLELAETLEIDAFLTERTHLWRATLNTLLQNVPEHIRNASFGHSKEIGRAHYTDGVDTSVVVAEYRRLRSVG